MTSTLRTTIGAGTVAVAAWMTYMAWLPFDAGRVIALSDARIGRAELERAVEIVEDGRARGPGNPELAAQLGRIQVMRARWRDGAVAAQASEAAVAAYRDAIDAAPLDAGRYADLGWAHLRLDDPSAAVAAFLDAIDRDPANVYLLASLGRAYENLGDVDAAVSTYRRAQAILPTSVVADRLSALGAGP